MNGDYKTQELGRQGKKITVTSFYTDWDVNTGSDLNCTFYGAYDKIGSR